MRARAWTLGFLAASVAYLAASLMFPFGNVARPGPGFYPVGVGIFLCLAAGALVLGAARGAPVGAGTPGRGPAADARARVIVTAAGLVGFCLLLPWIGYPISAFLFVALLLRRLGGTRWPGVVVTAAVSAFLSHYVFAVLLGVPLPGGPF